MRYTNPQGLRRVGAKRFVGVLIEGNRAGVVDFDPNAVLTRRSTTDFAAANQSVDQIDSFGEYERWSRYIQSSNGTGGNQAGY